MVLGMAIAFGAGAGYVARQDRGAAVEVVRPGAEGGLRQRNVRTVLASRGEPAAPSGDDRRGGRSPGGWRAVQLGLDALNALIGLVGIALAWKGLRPGAPPPQRAASHTPDRISTSPNK
jgi:hypothetical protein